MRLDKLTIKAQEALQQANELAGQRGHQELAPEHVLHALLAQDQGVTAPILRKLGADPDRLRAVVERALDELPQVRGSTAAIYVGRRLKDAIEEAERQSKEVKDEYV